MRTRVHVRSAAALIAIALVALATVRSNAEPLLRAPFVASSVGTVQRLGSADFNGDGKLDLAITTQYTGTVRVVLGLGDGKFTPPATYSVSQGGSRPAIADFTGDGKLDIAMADFPNYTVGILPGNGDGTFGDSAQVYVGFQCYTTAAGDLNGDGRLDLVAANWTNVAVLLGNGDGTFGPVATYPTPTNVYRLSVGDVSGDGKLDVVAAGDYNNQISVLLGVGNGTLQPAQGLILSAPLISDLEIADATGDGRADIVAGVSGGVSIFPSHGNGTFDPRIDVSVLDGSAAVQIADVNGDLHPDLVVGGTSGYVLANKLTVLLGDGAGGFPGPSTIESIYSLSDVRVAHVNGDSNLDIIVGNSPGKIAVHFGNGNGTFGASRRYATGDDPVSLGLGDLDGDGRADLVVAHRGSASISVRRGNGDGTFGIRLDHEADLITPRALALGDLNGDGHADVAVADAPESGGTGLAHVAIFSGYSGTSFATTGSYPFGTKLSGIAIGDLNADGASDLVVTDEVANRASVLINNGAGSFLAPVHYGAGNGASGVAIGDLNGDSHPDVVVANREAGSVTILFGAGNGTLVTEVELPTAYDCRAVAIGLLNGDGVPDLVAANGVSGTVSVLIGQGGGNFAPAIAIPTGTLPASVAIGSFDQDGIPDLALGVGDEQTSGPYSPEILNVVGVMLGAGGGSFQPPLLFGSGDLAQHVAVADLDGNGSADLVAANRSGNSVSVLMNTGSLVAVEPLTPTIELELGQGYPNPAQASVAIPFALPRETRASLRVFDAAGRKVRTVLENTLSAGGHVARWDRRTDAGTHAGAGVYFYELRVGEQKVTRRLVLI